MVESYKHFFDDRCVLKEVDEFFAQSVLVATEKRIHGVLWRNLVGNFVIVHTVHEVHIIFGRKSRDACEERVIFNVVEIASASCTNSRVESFVTRFTLRFLVEVVRVNIYGTRGKTVEFVKRTRELRVPSGKSTFAFVALEEYHIV